MTDHDRWADAAGAYVLGAMPDPERRRYEGHLAGCEICREEVEDLRPAAEALPVAAATLAPPPELKSRIMAEVEREAALLAQAGPAADRPEPQPRTRRSWLSGWRLAPAVATVLAAGVLGGFVLAGLGGGAQTYQGAIDQTQLQGASAELEVKDGQTTLVAEGLPEPEGSFQLWIMDEEGGQPRPGPLVLPRDGQATAAVPGAEDAAAVLVTREPKAGSQEPSEQPIITFDLS